MRVAWSLAARAPSWLSRSAETTTPVATWAQLPGVARLAVVGVVTAGVVAVALFTPHAVPDLPLLVTLLGAAGLVSSVRVPLPVVPATLSVACVVNLVALLLVGPELGVVVAVVSAWSQSVVGARSQPLHRVLYNMAALAITMAAAGATFRALGGSATPASVTDLLRPLVAAAVVYHACNTAIVAIAVAAASRQPVIDVWWRDLVWTAPSYVAGAGVAAVASATWQGPHTWLLPVLVAPCYLLFRSYRTTVERAEADAQHQREIERLHAETLAALAAARESAERYALAAESSKDGLWDWDVATDTLYCSERWKAMLGLQITHEVRSWQAWLDHIVPDDRTAFRRALDAHLRSEAHHFEHEYRILHRDGGVRSMLCRGTTVRDAGRPVRMAGSQSDMTEARRVQDRLSHAARHDALTGLPNRTLFGEVLQRTITQYQEAPAAGYAVLFVDLDGFKLVNDSLGHLVGDQFLYAIAHRLQTALRTGDVLARLGGDEFAVLVRHLEPSEDVRHIAERLRDAISTPFNVQGYELYASASVGIVTGNASYQSVDDLLRDADTAMYRSKASGRGGYEVFDPSMHETAKRRFTLETTMRHAAQRHDFVVYYQPIVALGSGELTGVEALVRWVGADGRIVPPGEFIPAAEENGLIVPITYFVLHEASRQVAAWQDTFSRPLTVSVNISTQLFSRPDLVDEVATAISTHGLRPDSLRLEVTESALLGGSDIVNDNFRRLRELPVSLYLDDFGTGYSSLSFLHRYPVDVLKLDKSFVTGMGTPGTDCRIGNAIISLARELGMGMIAEGVETAAQAAHLNSLGCPHAQGYLFAPPLSPEAMTQFLSRHAMRSLPAAS